MSRHDTGPPFHRSHHFIRRNLKEISSFFFFLNFELWAIMVTWADFLEPTTSLQFHTELEGEFQGFSGKKNKPLKGVCHSTRCITHSDTQLEVSI